MTFEYCKKRELFLESIAAVEDRQPSLVHTNPLLFYIKGVCEDNGWQKEFLTSLEDAGPYCLVCQDDYTTKLGGTSLGLPVVVYVISDNEQSAYRFVDATKTAKENPRQVWVCCPSFKSDPWQRLCINNFQESHTTSKFFYSLETLSLQIKLNVKHYMELYPGMEKPTPIDDNRKESK